MRFRDFLRTAVLLFGGAATALAAIAVIGAGRNDDRTLVLVSLGWWLLAALSGLWMGRGATTTEGIRNLLADARSTNQLPELEPGVAIFNRMWPLAVVATAAGVLGIFFPPVPAVAVGYAVLVALLWRKQSRAVEAIEGRDGVEFWLERSSPFGAPKLLRLPGMRKIEPDDPSPVSVP
jgi:hypothetical protein